MSGSEVLSKVEIRFFGQNQGYVVLDSRTNPDGNLAFLLPLYWARMMFNLAKS